MMPDQETMADALEKAFNEAVALDAGFDHEPPRSYWLVQAGTVMSLVDAATIARLDAERNRSFLEA